MDFHVTIDFADDLWFAQSPWTEQRLRQLVRGYADRGIKAIHWIEWGGIEEELLAKGTYLDRLNQAWDFIQRVPHPLAVIADEAHRNGMKAYSIFKLLDYVMDVPWASYPHGRGPQPPIGIDHIGGVGMGAWKWIKEHPTKRAELHPALKEKLPRRPLGTIRLWHEDANLPATGNVRLLVSDDNATYRPYDGPVRLRRELRRRRPPLFVPAPEHKFGPEAEFSCIELSGLKLEQPYLVLEFHDLALANTLVALVEMEDDAALPVAFTYGLIPRLTPGQPTPDWKQTGIAFDAAFGTDVNGRGWKLTRSGGPVRVEAGKRGFLALARGRNNFLGAMVEPAFPEVRQWAADVVGRALDDGADAVDLRTTTHTENLDWENYGFSPPILDEYRKRHGTDIATQPFDRSLWRRLRGDFFDQLVEQAAAAAHQRGKRLHTHIHNDFDAPVDVACFHEIEWHWRKWVEKGWTDLVNFNGVALREPLYPAAVEFCRKANAPRIMTFPMHSAGDEDWKRDGPILFGRAQDDGFAAYNIYESAAVCRLEQDGTFSYRCPSLWKMVEHYSAMR